MSGYGILNICFMLGILLFPLRLLFALIADARRKGGYSHRIPMGKFMLQWLSGPPAGSISFLSAGQHSVGRLPGSSIFIRESTISKEHAVLIVKRDGVYVMDLGSRNGTRIETMVLEPGKAMKVPRGFRIFFGRETAARLEEAS